MEKMFFIRRRKGTTTHPMLIPQVGSGEVRLECTQTLGGREIVSYRPSAHEKRKRK